MDKDKIAVQQPDFQYVNKIVRREKSGKTFACKGVITLSLPP
jgi:hypothetical protein